MIQTWITDPPFVTGIVTQPQHEPNYVQSSGTFTYIHDNTETVDLFVFGELFHTVSTVQAVVP